MEFSSLQMIQESEAATWNSPVHRRCREEQSSAMQNSPVHRRCWEVQLQHKIGLRREMQLQYEIPQSTDNAGKCTCNTKFPWPKTMQGKCFCQTKFLRPHKMQGSGNEWQLQHKIHLTHLKLLNSRTCERDWPKNQQKAVFKEKQSWVMDSFAWNLMDTWSQKSDHKRQIAFREGGLSSVVPLCVTLTLLLKNYLWIS